ncbi:hypothetical protein KAU15_03560, partial [candidate division WOR-3 bacterium]|nr:hypothetical protein [candidate division WOR-3 bacterium]
MKKIILIIILFHIAILIFSETIRSINIEGNIFFNDKKITSIMKSKKNKKFDRIIFTEDKLRIENHYKGEGFLDIKVKKYSFSGDGEFIDIVIEVYEEFRTVINEVKV